MSNPWFRFYSEALRDRKLERIIRTTGQPKALIVGVWATLLALANDSPEHGVLLLTDDIALTFDDFCLETGLDEDTLRPILDQFMKLEMISLDDGIYYANQGIPRNIASSMLYKEYLATPHWRRTRQKALERSGTKCEYCGAAKTVILQVHHLTYDNLGDELPEDLMVLCQKCHRLVHA